MTKKDKQAAALTNTGHAKQNDMAAYYFHQGTNTHASDYLGCHVKKQDDIYEYTFRVWAPNAERVELVGDFNNWRPGYTLARVTDMGVWEYKLTSEDSLDGENYKFAVFTILGVPEGESATVLSYYGYLEIGREKRQITETLERSLDTAVENAYANAQESGRQDVLEALEAVYGYVAGAEA